MHFTNILAAALPLLMIPGSVIANPAHHPVNPEYYSLGCPKSTRPYASKEQQLQAITDYGNLLYLQKKIETAEYTYVANDFINHAPEVNLMSSIIFLDVALEFYSFALQTGPGQWRRTGNQDPHPHAEHQHHRY